MTKKRHDRKRNLMTIYYYHLNLKKKYKKKRELYGEKEIEQDGVP